MSLILPLSTKNLMKETIEILNIPNYYCSYYLLGLSDRFHLRYKFDPRFERFNNRAFLIFSRKGKLAVIDNNDPSGTKKDLYDYVDFYFCTNKLINHPSYQQEKIRPLFPHFPVNEAAIYLQTFGFSLLKRIKLKDLIHQLHILNKRPKYVEKDLNYVFHNYIFFSANLWKKEPETNQIRADFIRACKKEQRIEFEGGFAPRTDGDAMGFPDEINKKIYPPKVFSKLSAKTLLALNNPAVLGAVSWRLAEYFAAGVFVISFPSAIEYPIEPVHGEELHYVENSQEFETVFEKVFSDPDYHKKIALGGRAYFEKYCTPSAQINYILSVVDGLVPH